MGTLRYFILILSLAAFPAFAQKTAPAKITPAKAAPAKTAPAKSEPTTIATGKTTVKKVERAPAANQLQMRFGVLMWQENLKVKNGASSGNMETQSQGMAGSLAYLIPTGGRTWLQSYSMDFGFGAMKGKGRSSAVPDELKGQLWLAGGFTPGLLYRTSPISALGLLMPFTYRLIKYELKGGSSFNPEGDSTFSVGVSGAYINQLSKNNYLYLAVTYQTLWAATQWNLSWQYRLF